MQIEFTSQETELLREAVVFAMEADAEVAAGIGGRWASEHREEAARRVRAFQALAQRLEVSEGDGI